MDKIVLEEHFVIPDFLDYLANAMPRVTKDEYDRVVAMLSDFGERRLSAMDGAGVRLAVLSMTGSGVQIERDTQLAIKRARQANDALAAETARRPDRYAGFAHLAMQDVKAAIAELQRCESASHALRLVVSGVFYRFPRMQPPKHVGQRDRE